MLTSLQEKKILSSLPKHEPSIFEALRDGPLRVAVLGCGNWGTAVANLVAENAATSYIFESEVRMWVRSEELCPPPAAAPGPAAAAAAAAAPATLVGVINEQHENTKYLPGIALAKNLVADSDLHGVVAAADLLLFILPHQFVGSICKELAGCVKRSAQAITLVKGIHVSAAGKPQLFSDIISSTLGIPCCAMSGANVARDVARRMFSESTIGFNPSDETSAVIWQQLLDAPHMRVRAIPDISGVQVCGALKNVVAVAAGFCDGLKMGTNTKAAIIRIGTEEMRLFAAMFFSGTLEETFFESSGFADMVTTCFGGRNVQCAEQFVVRGGRASWEEIERDLLSGQKMQGQLTCQEVHKVLEAHQLQSMFPLMEVTYRIAFQAAPAQCLLDIFQTAPKAVPRKLDECNPCLLPTPLSKIHQILAASPSASSITPGRASP